MGCLNYNTELKNYIIDYSPDNIYSFVKEFEHLCFRNDKN